MIVIRKFLCYYTMIKKNDMNKNKHIRLKKHVISNVLCILYLELWMACPSHHLIFHHTGSVATQFLLHNSIYNIPLLSLFSNEFF